MPYVDLAAPAEGSRLARARARWDAILAARPDLEPAVRLQRQLIGTVLSLAEAVDLRPLPRLSLPPGYLAAKLRRGVPAWTGVHPAALKSATSACRLIASSSPSASL